MDRRGILRDDLPQGNPFRIVPPYLGHGMHYWFEVILADPSHPSVSKDKELRARVLSGVA